MATVIIGDFGKDKDGIETYRLNGEKEDIERKVKEAREKGYEFVEEPIIEKSFRAWTLLLRCYLPEEEEKEE